MESICLDNSKMWKRLKKNFVMSTLTQMLGKTNATPYLTTAKSWFQVGLGLLAANWCSTRYYKQFASHPKDQVPFKNWLSPCFKSNFASLYINNVSSQYKTVTWTWERNCLNTSTFLEATPCIKGFKKDLRTKWNCLQMKVLK
jgi:hypothetical protein